MVDIGLYYSSGHERMHTFRNALETVVSNLSRFIGLRFIENPVTSNHQGLSYSQELAIDAYIRGKGVDLDALANYAFESGNLPQSLDCHIIVVDTPVFSGAVDSGIEYPFREYFFAGTKNDIKLAGVLAHPLNPWTPVISFSEETLHGRENALSRFLSHSLGHLLLGAVDSNRLPYSGIINFPHCETEGCLMSRHSEATFFSSDYELCDSCISNATKRKKYMQRIRTHQSQRIPKNS